MGVLAAHRAQPDAGQHPIRLPYIGPLPRLVEVIVSFWPLGRRHKAPEQAPPARVESVPTGLPLVELWTAEGRRTVAVDPGSMRVTDLLNGDPIVKVVVVDAAHGDPPPSLEPGPHNAWQDLDMDEVLLAFPPPQATDPRRRLHRPRQLIELAIGPFEVSGSVHVPPGAQAAGFLFRKGGRFEPVTRATVRDTRFELFEQRAEVVLVNLRRVDVLRDVGLGDSTQVEVAEGSDANPPSG